MLGLGRKKADSVVEEVYAEFLLPDGEGVKIKRMNTKHLREVLELERIIFKDPWSEHSFRMEIMNPTSFPMVAMVQERVVGYSVTWTAIDEVHIANIAVSPLYRRRGIGESLLKIILEEGIRRGFKVAHLEVRKSNTPAINLYEKFGFHRVGIRRGYYRDGEDAILMTKALG